MTRSTGCGAWYTDWSYHSRTHFMELLLTCLMKCYSVWTISTKSRQRSVLTIVDDLKKAFHLNDEGTGIRPVRACGTRWVSHKLSTMKRVINKFSAYTAHLTTLSTDSSIKAADHAKFRRTLASTNDSHQGPSMDLSVSY